MQKKKNIKEQYNHSIPMARTKFLVNSASRYNMVNHKSKRRLIKLFSRKAHHALRNENRYADELSFMIFNQSPKREIYSHVRNPNQIIFGRTLGQYADKLRRSGKATNDSMRKRLQQELRKMQREESDNPQLGGSKRRTRAVDDVFIAAYKRSKRRGSLAPFQGHREKGMLYKREATFQV